MLTAIAIYSYDENQITDLGIFKRIDFSQQSTVKSIFQFNLLEDLEKKTLPKIAGKMHADVNTAADAAAKTKTVTGSVMWRQENDEHHYLDTIHGEKILIAICSKKKLYAFELFNLFANIKHVYYRPEKVKTSLADIIANPVGYIGRDMLIAKVHQTNSEVIPLALKAVDKMLERGEDITVTVSKTIQLQDNANIYFEKTKTLKKRCC